MRVALVSFLTAMLVLAGCPSNSTEAPVVCLEAGALDTSCTPPFEPTYDNVYANVFQPSCAKTGFSCHSPEGRQGGLDFFDKEAVFAVMKAGPVRGGSPECSDLVQRLVSTDGLYRMPPGANLAPEKQCAVIRWIAEGANR